MHFAQACESCADSFSSQCDGEDDEEEDIVMEIQDQDQGTIIKTISKKHSVMQRCVDL